MLNRGTGLLGALLVGMIVTAAVPRVLAEEPVQAGKVYRLVLTNNTEVVGEVTEAGDAYKVKVGAGIIQTIRKSQVRRLTLVAGGQAGGGGGGSLRYKITDEEIQDILGDESVEDLYVWDYVKPVDLMAELPTDEGNLELMLRIAGRQAKYLETDHFVLVYSSTIQKAKKMAARFEAVYKWRVWFLEQMGVLPIRPDYRLEMFFFGTHDEFMMYDALHGSMSQGVLGFWHPNDNRSAYFDLDTYGPLQRFKQRYADPNVDYQIRRRGSNLLKRWTDHNTMETVQHEVGHHIDFSIGFFPPRADVPRWLPEGLTMQFEATPSKLGASFGKVNYSRLDELRQQYGPQLETLPMLRDFMLRNEIWFQSYQYPLGWALVHYLIKNFPEEFPEFMQIMAQREDDRGVIVPLAEKLEQMEKLFGEIDEEWTQRFKDYINAIAMRQSELPPKLADLP